MARVHRTSVGAHDVATIASGPPWNQNCYLITERATATVLVVDPGADSPELRDAIRATGSPPSLILVTHGHPDHLGAAATLCEEFDLDCLAGAGEERIVRHAPAYAAAFGKAVLAVPRRIRYIGEGTDIRLGTEAVRIVAVPGHTPGSLAVQIGAIVLTGDALFRERVGRTDLPGGDVTTLVRSVDHLLADLPAATGLFAGHGRPWTAGEARGWWQLGGRAETGVVSS